MSILDFLRNDLNGLSDILSAFASSRKAGLRGIDTAEEEFIDALSLGLSPADLAGLSTNELDGLLESGLQYALAGNFDEAETVLTKLTQLEPMHERGYYALGVVAQRRGDVKTAITRYMMFLALDATNARGYLRLGECLIQDGADDDARAALKMAESLAGNELAQADIAVAARELLKSIGAHDP